jgi:hypothetical protein
VLVAVVEEGVGSEVKRMSSVQESPAAWSKQVRKGSIWA